MSKNLKKAVLVLLALGIVSASVSLARPGPNSPCTIVGITLVCEKGD
jgi:hypothetical protein